MLLCFTQLSIIFLHIGLCLEVFLFHTSGLVQFGVIECFDSPTAVQYSSYFVNPHASGTRQAVCFLTFCTHEVYFCLSNYPPDFSPTCQNPVQYGCLRCGLVRGSVCEGCDHPLVRVYNCIARGLPCISGLSVTKLDYYKQRKKHS